MNLTFVDRELARLCNRRARLEAWAGQKAVVLTRLLNELDCADNLRLLKRLPHLDVAAADGGRAAIWDVQEAYVLLEPDDVVDDREELPWSAEAALVLAVAVGDEECNPEGERWPSACGLSPITR